MNTATCVSSELAQQSKNPGNNRAANSVIKPEVVESVKAMPKRKFIKENENNKVYNKQFI